MSLIQQLHEKLQSKELSCTELTRHYLDAIDRYNPSLGAYVLVTADLALSTAAEVDKKIAAGNPLSPLEGIPLALKDNISTKGIETTCCSNMLKGYQPLYDATVWELLKRQNAVLLGKTNMDEFAMGSSGETSCFGSAKNPHNPTHVAGGSSGGSAAAVSAHLAACSLGSDTGGSIRQPASFCGVVGFKPTYGAVSRYGLIAYASSLDQIGPIAPTVTDAALLYDAIAQPDKRDATSCGQRMPATPALEQKISGIKIGVPEEYLVAVRDDVRAAIVHAIAVFQSLGAQVEWTQMPSLRYALPAYYILACAEASSNLGRYDGIRYGYQTPHYSSTHEMICKTRSEAFGPEAKRRILLGTYVLSAGYYDAYYQKAHQLRGKIRSDFKELFSRYDLLLAPTMPTTAFPLQCTQRNPVETYQTGFCTVPANLAGLPAISVPCATDPSGLPIGLQILADAFCEEKLLNAARQFEKAVSPCKTTDIGVIL